MPAVCFQRNPFDPRVNPITEDELEAMARAWNKLRRVCCIKGCGNPRMDWEAVKGEAPYLRGSGFCAQHLPRIT